MSLRPAPEELLPWALALLGEPASGVPPTLSVVAGDASPRRYFRVVLGNSSYVLVEAPPATEKNAAFVQVDELLCSAGVKVLSLIHI